MIINYNEFFRLRVDVLKVKEDYFQMTIENVYLGEEKGFTNSKQEHFFNKEQLNQFVNYINEATRDHI